jgi:hypothetical protein
MRARTVFIVALMTLAIAPSTALAKGAISANINGPGTGGGIRLNGSGESGSGTHLGALADGSGFWAQAYGATSGSSLEGRPKGDLGPRYVVSYTMEPGDKTPLVQHIYPFAERGPVTFMAPGQTFYGAESTKGGWFDAAPEFVDTLIAIGLPKVALPPAPETDAPVASTQQTRAPKTSSSHSQSEPSTTNWLLWSVVAVAVALIGGAGTKIAIRRRPGSTTIA